MKKKEILAAMNDVVPLLYDPEYHRSYGSPKSTALLVRVVRAVPEGESFSKEKAEKLAGGYRGLRSLFVSYGYRSKTYSMKRLGWLVEEVPADGALAPLKEILAEVRKPGRLMIVPSRLLICEGANRVAEAKSVRAARVAKEENLLRYGDVLEEAKGLGWVRLTAYDHRVSLTLNGASHYARGVNVPKVLRAADGNTEAAGKAELPPGGLTNGQVLGAVYDLDGVRPFGKIASLGEGATYADSGFEVTVTVTDEPEAIRALVDAAAQEAAS